MTGGSPAVTVPGIAYAELIYERHGDVGVITLNRPDVRNALTHTTYAELEHVVRNSSDRCLVITGADPAFCSGDDVKKVMVAAGNRSRKVCGRSRGLRRPRPRSSAPTSR